MSPTFDPERVDAVTFDSYGTLVDTGAAATVLEGVVDDPAAVAREWRENALFFSVVAGPLDALCARLLDRRGRPSLSCRASTETQASCVWEYRDVYRGAGTTSWRRYWTVP